MTTVFFYIALKFLISGLVENLLNELVGKSELNEEEIFAKAVAKALKSETNFNSNSS